MAAPQITPREIVEELVEEIGRRRSARFAADDDTYNRRNPIASDVDPDSCKRRQVLSIVKGDEAKPFDEYLKARFEIGHLFEREAGRELAGLGYDLIHQQLRFELSSRDTGETCLSGKIDGKIAGGAIEIPYETKSVHPAQWVRLKTIEDLYRSRFYRKYVFQLTAYLLGHGLEVGFLWLTDCLGHWRAIIIEIDYELAERIWKFAEDVVAAVRRYRDDGTLPAYTENKQECGDCAFFGRSCQPEIPNVGVVMYKNGMLEAKLEELDELTETGKKYTAARDKVKKWIKELEADPELAGQEQIVVGDFVIEFTDRHRQGYTVEPVDYRQSKIRRVFATPKLAAPDELAEAWKKIDELLDAKIDDLDAMLEKPADELEKILCALMPDILEGKVNVAVANATVQASRQLIKMVELRVMKIAADRITDSEDIKRLEAQIEKIELEQRLEKPEDAICAHGIARDLACDECNRSRFEWNEGTA